MRRFSLLKKVMFKQLTPDTVVHMGLFESYHVALSFDLLYPNGSFDKFRAAAVFRMALLYLLLRSLVEYLSNSYSLW